MMSNFRTRKLARILCVLAINYLAWGQGTQVSQIGGTVRDQLGGVIPAAQVSITNTDTNITRQAETGTDGGYILANLPPGSYKLHVAKSGFASFEQIGITLEVNTNPELNVTLKVGQGSEQVQVEGEGAQVETHYT